MHPSAYGKRLEVARAQIASAVTELGELMGMEVPPALFKPHALKDAELRMLAELEAAGAVLAAVVAALKPEEDQGDGSDHQTAAGAQGQRRGRRRAAA